MFGIIGAIAGYYLLGRHIYGGILGFAVGSYLDRVFAGRGSKEDPFKYYQQESSRTSEDFATMLISLSAAVMKADGKPLKSELDYVKGFFSRQFGPQFTTNHLKVLKHFLDGGEVPIERICSDIHMRTQEEVRIQLIHYLFGLAKANGHVSETELQVIHRISNLLGVPSIDFESVKNMFYRDANSDYHILGIEPTATEEEIKKAYRQMAIRYHPDKVASLGEEYQAGAKEKFQKLQDSYENIKKVRGIN